MIFGARSGFEVDGNGNEGKLVTFSFYGLLHGCCGKGNTRVVARTVCRADAILKLQMSNLN